MLLSDPHRSIVHFDLDTFFVSVERLLDSKLKNRPVLVGGLGDRGVVASCSYEARNFGIYSGMSMKIARRLCPEAAVVKGDSGKYSKYSSDVTQIIKESVPLVEKASVDEFYLPLSKLNSSNLAKITLKVGDKVSEPTAVTDTPVEFQGLTK